MIDIRVSASTWVSAIALAAMVGTVSAQTPSSGTSFNPLASGAILRPSANTPTVSSPTAAVSEIRSGAGSSGPADVPAVVPQAADYRANLSSDVFGTQLFTGAFARTSAAQFNPDYAVATGDTIHVRLWGAFELDTQLTVDPQGNVFLPHVGPVPVRGVRNQDLQGAVDSAIRRVFRTTVNSYASLAAAQPVRVFVSGFVNRPGQYSGTSMDSLLYYLDQAGGIDPERGTFLAVQVRRGSQVRATVNLYEFLLEGRLPAVQLAAGDVIFVGPKSGSAKVSGLAENARRFEFAGAAVPLADISRIARPQAQATHVRINRNTGQVRNTEYVSLADASAVVVGNGDEIEFTSDKKPGTISVRVEGEHRSPQEYVLPYGSPLGDLLQRIELTERSEPGSVQLFRHSVRERQKQMLATSLKSLEAALLTARSGSSDEARLRKEEAELTLQWVERAKQIEPLGQVLIAQSITRDRLLLENGDVIRIPRRDGLVLINGEVLFPNAVAHETSLTLRDYINRAGGFTQSADNARVVVARTDGSFDQVDAQRGSGQVRPVQPGDQILVLPKVDEKQRQFWKDLTQIIFQIAVSAKVVLGL